MAARSDLLTAPNNPNNAKETISMKRMKKVLLSAAVGGRSF